MEKAFYSGTSGLILPVPNKQYYPSEFRDKSRLNYYGSLFNSIEINSSFYKIPMQATVKKWAESVPEDFKFTFKLWREITHIKGFSFDPEQVQHFIETINQVGTKKGCLLVQFPPSMGTRYFPQLTLLLNTIREADPTHDWNLALEFRDAAWYQESTYHLMNEFKAGLVIHDKPRAITPMITQEANFIYLRFHGPNGDYKGSYEADFLTEYASYIQEWINEGKTVFVYFNNTAGDAIRNLQTLSNEVHQRASIL
ncbi:DUF72 domain-containing protein [Pedobacter gandavensis]|uniref:DUF72 domain-containing protein n=1 Tax=Pedobacter gandavensis TaxID=2679963 RepID=A0ABR6EZA1_9SPHI|nr:DUF72 domain-containing protein [Pedobacter gandavensis]MBB2150577.1 DUF72 domain-containing protein [Pedobacter gandavensis]